MNAAVRVPPNPLANGMPIHRRVVMPVSADTARAANHWALYGSSKPIPAQVKPLASVGKNGITYLRVDTVTTAHGLLRLEPISTAIRTEHPVNVSQRDDALVIGNDLVQVTLAADAGPIVRSLVHRGVALADETTGWSMRHVIQGRTFTSDSGKRELRVIDSGPLYAAAEAYGQCMSDADEPGLHYRLRVESFADLPVLAIRLWFFHTLAGAAELSVRELTLTGSLPAAVVPGCPGAWHVRQLKHGLAGTPRDVRVEGPLYGCVGHDGATVWRLADAGPLNDDTNYPPYQMPPSDEVAPWFACELPTGWCAVSVDDLRELRPKGLRVGGSAMSLEVWPCWAGPMRLPQGRSRSVTMRLVFGGDAAHAGRGVHCDDVEALLATTGPDPLLPQGDVSAGETLDGDFFDKSQWLAAGAEGAARFDHYLRRVAAPPTVADMFDLGDTPDPGYQTTYMATGRRIAPIDPGQAAPVDYLVGANFRAAPWCDLSGYEQVWANNEYDVIWCMACEALRSGRADLLRPMRWFARHAIEVDFVHYSDHRWKHRCTPPHSARHTSAGAYPSHFWTEGVLAYYLLTGDEDALAFARAIGDKIIEFFGDAVQRDKLWHPTRELGWALLSVAALAQVDDQEKYHAISRRIADALTQAPIDSDEYISKAVTHSFAFASLVLGLDRWYGVCGEARYRNWIVMFAQRCADSIRNGPGGMMTLCILHAGYKHSGDERLVRCGMRVVERLLDSPSWHSPLPYTKSFAMLHRPLCRFLGDAHAKGLLAPFDYRY